MAASASSGRYPPSSSAGASAAAAAAFPTAVSHSSDAGDRLEAPGPVACFSMALPFPFDEADGDRPVADCRRSARPAFPTSPIEAIAVALRNGQGGTQARRCIVLSHSEQRIWDDIERFWADEAEEPERPGVRSPQREEPGSEPTALW